jgi:hypothetical protein
MNKKPWYGRLWDALGGKKYVAVLMGTVVVYFKGDIPPNYLILLGLYMGANILTRYVDGQNGKKRDTEMREGNSPSPNKNTETGD